MIVIDASVAVKWFLLEAGSDAANVGRVISVDPAAGTEVDAGSTVTLTVGVAGTSSSSTMATADTGSTEPSSR